MNMKVNMIRIPSRLLASLLLLGSGCSSTVAGVPMASLRQGRPVVRDYPASSCRSWWVVNPHSTGVVVGMAGPACRPDRERGNNEPQCDPYFKKAPNGWTPIGMEGVDCR